MKYLPPDTADKAASDRFFDDVAGPTARYDALGPLFAPANRWVFCSDMRPEEAWLFKQYDTRDNVAKASFHTSFVDPFHLKNPDTPARRTCEFRMLLAFPKKDAASAAAPYPRL